MSLSGPQELKHLEPARKLLKRFLLLSLACCAAMGEVAGVQIDKRQPYVRIPTKPITHSNPMAIRIPKDADHFRSEATLSSFYHP